MEVHIVRSGSFLASLASTCIHLEFTIPLKHIEWQQNRQHLRNDCARMHIPHPITNTHQLHRMKNENLATLYIVATMSDSNPNNKPMNMYMNTLVFSIIALVFAAIMLTLLLGKSKYAEMVRPYSAFIITVQVGLILIVIWALYRVWVYEKKLSDMYDSAFSKTGSCAFRHVPIIGLSRKMGTVRESATEHTISEMVHTSQCPER